MNFRSLELFCCVAEHRSLSRAAADRGLTQSAVSQAMQQLEESVGVQLLDRSRRPLSLTPAGEIYHAGVQQIVRSYQRLEERVRSLQGKLAGQITIAAIYSIGSTYMPAAKAEFCKQHPGVSVRFEYASSEGVVELVEEGGADFGLVSYPRNSKRLQSVLWQQEPMRLICSAASALASRTDVELSHLDGMEIIGFDPKVKVRRAVDSFLARHGVSVDVTMEFDNIDSMIRAVEANGGVSILPEATVRKETASGSLRVVACKQMKLTRPIGIIFKRSGKLSPAADEFASMLLGRPISSAVASRGARKSVVTAVDSGGGVSAKTPTRGVSIVA